MLSKSRKDYAMETKFQLQKKADVVTINGQPIGFIERVVLNPVTKVITDIVVSSGVLFNKEDKVIPIDLVAETTQDLIVLREEAGELKGFPPFEEKRVVAEKINMDQPNIDMPRSVNYGFPEVGPAPVQAPGDQFVTQLEQNIPQGTVAMKEGAKVITSEGKHVGNVECVYAEPSVGQITHLLVSYGVFNKEAKLVPIKWVMSMGEDEVYLRVPKDSIEELADASMALER